MIVVIPSLSASFSEIPVLMDVEPVLSRFQTLYPTRNHDGKGWEKLAKDEFPGDVPRRNCRNCWSPEACVEYTTVSPDLF